MTCSKCGREAPVGQSWCGVCRGPVEFSARERKSLEVDVRARVLWGESLQAIRDDWVGKGAPADAVRDVLEAAMRERRRHFRKRGFLDLLMGLGCFLLAGVFLALQQAVYHRWIHIPSKAEPLLFVPLLLLPVSAASLAIRGVGRILRGGVEEKSASDLGWPG